MRAPTVNDFWGPPIDAQASRNSCSCWRPWPSGQVSRGSELVAHEQPHKQDDHNYDSDLVDGISELYQPMNVLARISDAFASEIFKGENAHADPCITANNSSPCGTVKRSVEFSRFSDLQDQNS